MLPWLKQRRTTGRINQIRHIEELQVVSQYPSSCNSPLTKEEKDKVQALWGQVVPVTSFKEFEMFKHQYGFDERFLTHHIYLPILARLLNDYSYTKMFDDKGLLGYLGNPSIKLPICYARYIEKDFYTNDMRQISRDEVIKLCANQNELFIKPSKETSGGKGAELIRLADLSANERISRIEKAINERNRNYVIQECLHQHPTMAQFNESSINTFRITTLLLNGIFSVCSIILRFGRSGMTVDNWGAGGLMVNVNGGGDLSEKAYDIQLNEYTSVNNIVFKDFGIDFIPDILKQIEYEHTNHFALCKFIGWDVAVDKQGEAVVLELNSSQPGVICEQLISGPIFGNRTQEVIDYCKMKEFRF